MFQITVAFAGVRGHEVVGLAQGRHHLDGPQLAVLPVFEHGAIGAFGDGDFFIDASADAARVTRKGEWRNGKADGAADRLRDGPKVGPRNSSLPVVSPLNVSLHFSSHTLLIR